MKESLNEQFVKMQKIAGIKINEALSDLAKRDYPKEQNAVVRYYLELLHNIEKNYTDDLDDLKNLTTAIGFFHKELINKLNKLNKNETTTK